MLLLAGIAYYILVRSLLLAPGNELLASALGSDFKGKISIVIYAIAIPLAFVRSAIALALYIFVAMIWLIPDRRIERKIT